MVRPTDPCQPTLKELYERLALAFATSDAGWAFEIQEALGRIRVWLEASTCRAGLVAEIRERFDPETWLQRIAHTAEETGVEGEAARASLARTLGDRLVKLHTLADMMGDEEDVPDLRDHLVFAYVESRSEWQQLNGIVNYAIARNQEPSPETLARAVLISALIGELDDLFGAENIEVLTDYLFAPLPNAHELTLRRQAFAAA